MENDPKRRHLSKSESSLLDKDKENPTNLNDVLMSLDPDKREIITNAIYAIEEHKAFSGPLPAPEDFKTYKDVLPDAPERIMSMAETQIDHRIKTETKIVDAGIRESKQGQYIGAIIVLVCILVSAYLGMHGHDWLAGAMVAITATVGTIFVLHKEPNKDNRAIDTEADK